MPSAHCWASHLAPIFRRATEHQRNYWLPIDDSCPPIDNRKSTIESFLLEAAAISSANHNTLRIEHVPCGVLTVSDTRTEQTDGGGRRIRELLEGDGHAVVAYEIVKDEFDEIRRRVTALTQAETCRAILITGGTGVTARDVTCEAIDALLDKRLDGFGELFRMLSYEQIGAAAMLSRAVAGTVGRCVVYVMPGSPAAVELAMEKLILPQLGHIVSLLDP